MTTCASLFCLAGVTIVTDAPPRRVSLEELSDYSDSNSYELEVEEDPLVSPRIVEVLIEEESSDEAGSSCAISSSSALQDSESIAIAQYNDDLFDQFKSAANSNLEKLRCRLVFFFDGRLVTQRQFDLYRQIQKWLETLDDQRADKLFRIVVEQEWIYLVDRLLRIVPHPPSIEIFAWVVARGQFNVANTILESLLAVENFQRLRFLMNAHSFSTADLQAQQGLTLSDFEYQRMHLEVLVATMVDLRFLRKDDARTVLAQMDATLLNEGARLPISPRSIVSLGQAIHRRTKSFFSKESPAESGDNKRGSRSAGNSPRDDDDTYGVGWLQ